MRTRSEDFIEFINLHVMRGGGAEIDFSGISYVKVNIILLERINLLNFLRNRQQICSNLQPAVKLTNLQNRRLLVPLRGKMPSVEQSTKFKIPSLQCVKNTSIGTYSSLPNNCAAKPYSFLRIFFPTRPYSILHVY